MKFSYFFSIHTSSSSSSSWMFRESTTDDSVRCKTLFELCLEYHYYFQSELHIIFHQCTQSQLCRYETKIEPNLTLTLLRCNQRTLSSRRAFFTHSSELSVVNLLNKRRRISFEVRNPIETRHPMLLLQSTTIRHDLIFVPFVLLVKSSAS